MKALLQRIVAMKPHLHVHVHRPQLETIHRRRKWKTREQLRDEEYQRELAYYMELFGATDERDLARRMDAHDRTGRPYVSAIPARDDIPSWGEVMRRIYARIVDALSMPSWERQ